MIPPNSRAMLLYIRPWIVDNIWIQHGMTSLSPACAVMAPRRRGPHEEILYRAPYLQYYYQIRSYTEGVTTRCPVQSLVAILRSSYRV